MFLINIKLTSFLLREKVQKNQDAKMLWHLETAYRSKNRIIFLKQ